MKRWIPSLTVAAAAVAVAAGPAGRKPEASVQVVGLQVTRALPGDQRTQRLTGRKTGTAITLRVARRDRYLLGLDRKASRLIAFRDDRKTELVSESARLLGTWLDGRQWTSDDGRECIFDLLARRIPARGAREVSLHAELAFHCGVGAVTDEHAGFRLEKDRKLTVGALEMKISEVQRDPNATYVTFSTPEVPQKIARIAFLDADGKQIEAHNLGRSVVGFMGNTIHETTFGLKKRVDTVTLRIKHFRKIRKLTVPVNVTVSVGL